jgi:protein-tyrosine phosphatase
LAGDSPKLLLGCDFHLSVDNIQDAFAHPSRYVIEDTHYLLVEFNNYSIPLRISDTFMQFRNLGITPIITHPERNPMLRKDLQRVLEWVEQDCVVQVTGSALTGFWGEDARRAALELFKQQAVHVLATDAHDTEKRVPILSSAREAAVKICGKEIAEALVEGNPRAIVNNQPMPLPYFPRPVMTRAKKY